jgi:hypothetical protein
MSQLKILPTFFRFYVAVYYFLEYTYSVEPISVAALTNAHFCGRSLARVAVSNPAVGMNVCLMGMLCVLQVEASAMS